ncbi:hypothetical protein XELAEV_18002015mg [Xenopus laevis]|uniref:Uncharacterized protein n=1 Tax=Xenopus laevis TaxID=8355 RepID=A0A974BNQ6_XENLA|nr:hypothetical protein XELAEV_18002015mg [Xenopus laevis]
MQPSLGPPEFQLPACNVPVFEPCMTNPLQAQPEHLLPINVQTIPSTEQYWRDVADHNQKALGDALVENNQVSDWHLPFGLASSSLIEPGAVAQTCV